MYPPRYTRFKLGEGGTYQRPWHQEPHSGLKKIQSYNMWVVFSLSNINGMEMTSSIYSTNLIFSWSTIWHILSTLPCKTCKFSKVESWRFIVQTPKHTWGGHEVPTWRRWFHNECWCHQEFTTQFSLHKNKFWIDFPPHPPYNTWFIKVGS